MRFLTLLPLILFIFLCLSTGPVLAEIPTWIDGDGALPLWVSADEAIAGDTIHWELLPPAARQKIERQLKMSREARRSGIDRKEGDPCWAWYSAQDIEPQPSVGVASEKHLAQLSGLTLAGRVTDSALGFYNGWPATLFEVAVEHAIKLPDHVQAPAYVYIVRLGGNIPVGEDLLCFLPNRSRDTPQLDGRILVALEKASNLAEPWLLWPGAHELFFESPGKALSAPTSYTVHSATFDELLQAFSAAGAEQ